MTTAAILLLALGLDALIGWPNGLYNRIGHPVTWIGALISRLEKTLNRPEWHKSTRRLMGILTALFTILLSFLLGRLIENAIGQGVVGFALSVLIAWPLLAARSLYTHVRDVAVPLEAQDLPQARTAVAMIVGRNPEQLDGAGVGRAAIESLAENASDGVVAPVFWGLLFGLPGLMAYKTINTLDSMIGYKNMRFSDFGWAAARIDDLANWAPARITGGLIALMSGQRKALVSMREDAGKHRSPNAGWPESAMAGALDVRLSGPRVYDGVATQDPWLNTSGRDVTGADVGKALVVFRRSMFGLAALLGLLALL